MGANPILKISGTPLTVTIKRNKVVSGNFGPQMWLAVTDAAGDEASLYAPLGVQNQFVRGGAIGPEDMTHEEGAELPGLNDTTWTFTRVFKDGKQFVNADRVQNPVLAAAARELDLERVQDDATFFAKLAQAAATPPVPVAPAAAPRPPRATRAQINAAFDEALAHVLGAHGETLASLPGDASRAAVAAAATLLIQYEKSGAL
jgi:hypothetical protein